MSEVERKAADMAAPSGASKPTAADRLAGTGTTEDASDTALVVGQMATIMVGTGTSVRVAFGSAVMSGGGKVAATDLEIPAGGRFDWMVTARDKWVAVESAVLAYEVWVWQSSGPRAAT